MLLIIFGCISPYLLSSDAIVANIIRINV